MVRRLLLPSLFFLWCACVAAATLPELLQKAKEEFRSEKYSESLRTLDELEAESRKPGFERDQAALEPVLAFYRGACLAALGRKIEAKQQFQSYLRVQPNASLDSSVYPKKVIAVFEDARKSLGPPEPQSLSIGETYRSFSAPAAPAAEQPGEDWADGPVRFLLTAGERDDYAQRRDPVSRSEFVAEFWKRRDSKPETAENEFRQEFEKRVAFANAQLTQGEAKGSLTDRGMVFILLGPPTYIGRKPLGTGEDGADSAGLSSAHSSDARVAIASQGQESSARKGTASDKVAAADHATGPGRTITEGASNWREVWHYRKENLPREVPYLQVDFEFVTKRGYGENVLQREAQALDTLERAKARLRGSPT